MDRLRRLSPNLRVADAGVAKGIPPAGGPRAMDRQLRWRGSAAWVLK
jgi:hypothetical protein